MRMDITAEIDALATAYFAIKRMPPEAHDRALTYLVSRIESEDPQEQKAALAVTRFIRKLARLTRESV